VGSLTADVTSTKSEATHLTGPRTPWTSGNVWSVNMRIAIAIFAGYVIGVISAFAALKPFRWDPDLGDVPTWLAVAIAAIGGYAAFRQLRYQQTQIAEEAKRNEKRDILLESQLAEAAERSKAFRRRQAERINLKRANRSVGRIGIAYVRNDSKRPIRDVTCRLRLDGSMLMPQSFSVGQGLGVRGVLKLKLLKDYLPASKHDADLARGCYRAQLAGETIKAEFLKPVVAVRDMAYLVRFVDDAGARWQLDENMHLQESPDADW
jgi:hypothetical protein